MTPRTHWQLQNHNYFSPITGRGCVSGFQMVSWDAGVQETEVIDFETLSIKVVAFLKN